MYYVLMPYGERLQVYPNQDAATAAHRQTPGSRMFIEPEIGAALARLDSSVNRGPGDLST